LIGNVWTRYMTYFCLEPVQNLFAHVLLGSFPPYFAKILVNTQSVACGFGFIWRKYLLAELAQLAQLRARRESKKALINENIMKGQELYYGNRKNTYC